jgi:hypothetical protein
MKSILVALALVLVASPAFAGRKQGAGKKQEAAKPVDPNAVLAKTHGGKVWVLSGMPSAVEGEELGKWLSARPTNAELSKKGSEDRWPCTLLAVFKSLPAKGHITIRVVDKKEPKAIVEEYSSQTVGTSLVFQEFYEPDGGNGFNKGHTYTVMVGQLIKNKFVSYASGDVTLK